MYDFTKSLKTNNKKTDYKNRNFYWVICEGKVTEISPHPQMPAGKWFETHPAKAKVRAAEGSHF